jgi:oxygen-independent coproporphyrinogen-3 oxidase
VAKAIELAPDSITIYQMEIPYNTTIYRNIKSLGVVGEPVADWATKRRWVSDAFAELERAGYTVSSAYTVVKDPATAPFAYRDSLWHGADLLGLGVSSFSHIGGTHFQNEHDFEPYMERVERGELPILRGLALDTEERLIRELVLQLKLGRVDAGYFEHKFAVDIRERFRPQFDRLHQEGSLSADGPILRLSRDALLQVDGLLEPFFLEQHQHARYA